MTEIDGCSLHESVLGEAADEAQWEHGEQGGQPDRHDHQTDAQRRGDGARFDGMVDGEVTVQAESYNSQDTRGYSNT